jgi:hypothetical protein
MEVSYRPQQDWFRIECTRDEYQAVIDALQSEKRISISANALTITNKFPIFIVTFVCTHTGNLDLLKS